ncbi:hypothetical protein KCP77_01685 [Salmonella enterica subsp. enterica]|nr:hypothetical protein KCP77_01685 [Salmonella enterica subsp. enterica]
MQHGSVLTVLADSPRFAGQDLDEARARAKRKPKHVRGCTVTWITLSGVCGTGWRSLKRALSELTKSDVTHRRKHKTSLIAGWFYPSQFFIR